MQYLTVIMLAALVFFVFSFFLCFLCLDALIVLRLGGALSNTAYYRLVSPPANLRLLLTGTLLLCMKPFCATTFAVSVRLVVSGKPQETDSVLYERRMIESARTKTLGTVRT